MLAIHANIVCFFIFLHVSDCGRRIQDGLLVKAEKPYVVYLVKAPLSKSGYDSWLCGGALVTSEFVVTSAACIKDVDYLYVIAGYNKYVTDQEIDIDPCTSKKKKKVIFTCYPEGYDLRFDRLDKWSLIDIGVAKVESPYDFSDQSYKTLCSYIPGMIPINYEAKYQQPGTDAIVLGWGHKLQWRQVDDQNNYNEEYLNYAPVMILDKKECKSHYEEHGRMTEVIDAYMICTFDTGNINDFGTSFYNEQDIKVLPYGCANRKSLAFNPEAATEACEYDDDDGTRREIKKSSNGSMMKVTNKTKTMTEANETTMSNTANLSKIVSWNQGKASIKRFGLTNGTILTSKTFLNKTVSSRNIMHNMTRNFNENITDSRRYGICQNDHGGPLVTWVGTHEILIGVASVFKVTKKFTCEGPYLYTSTQCNGAFLDCILAEADFDVRRRSSQAVTNSSSRRSFCRKSPNDEKHHTTERHISWLYHPAGAADHERHLINGKNEPGANEKAPETNEDDINKSRMSINPYPHAENNKEKSVSGNAPNNMYMVNNQYPPNDTPRLTNNKYSTYNEPALNYNPARIHNNAPNNGPELNFKSEEAYIPAQNNKPELNFQSERNNGYVLKASPLLNNNSERNNNNKTNNDPKLNHKLAKNKKPQIIQNKIIKLMRRPTIPA